MRTVVINKNDAGQRLDKFLQKYLCNFPISLMYRCIRQKRIKLNGARTKQNVFLAEGDVLELYISEEFFDKDNARHAYLRLKKEPVIAYEDENIIIADKNAGLLCHSDDKEDFDTLINRITAYLYRSGEYDPETEQSFAPALCNRIDRNTSGLVIAAKNAAALKEMNAIIKERQLKKTYLAVAHGIFTKKSGTLEGYLTKDSEKNIVKVVRSQKHGDTRENKGEAGKFCITKYKVIAENKERALSALELELVTGRTHQIRAQLADAGHSLLGDGKYANNRKDREEGYTSQSLHAYKLEFFCSEDKKLLYYLNGKVITAKKVDFMELF